jgi:hypothetical protein
MKRTAFIVLVAFTIVTLDSVAAHAAQPEAPASCAVVGTVTFKPPLVATIPPKPNGRPGKDRRVKVKISATLSGCSHQPQAHPNDPASGALTVKDVLPSRLLTQALAAHPIPDPSSLRIKWRNASGKQIGISRPQPGPNGAVWTVTSATTATFAGTFAVNSKTYPRSPFTADVVYPIPNPSSLSTLAFSGSSFAIDVP